LFLKTIKQLDFVGKMIFSLIVDISKNKKEENNVPVETVYVID